MKISTLSCLCWLLFFSFNCAVVCAMAPAGKPRVSKGLIDLRKQSFAENIALDGQWKFYWHQLVMPGQPPKESMLTEFPLIWNKLEINGKTLPGFGYATYQTRILLPHGKGPFRMGVPETYSAYALYANGRLVAANGQVSTSATGFVPHWRYRAFDIPLGTDTLDLLFQVANFSHYKGGIKKSIVIGEKAKVELTRQRAGAIDLVLTGCLIMGGLFFFGLYLLGNRDKAILLFSLYSIVYSYRIAGVDNYVLHTVFPDLDWYITIKLEYISLFLGISLFTLYTRYLYPEDISKKVVVFVSILCFCFALYTLLTAPVYFTRLINPFLLIMLLCIIYTPYVYIKAYQKKRPGALYALLSSAAMMSVFTITLLHYWNIAPPMRAVSFAGYMGFFMLQSMVLSHRVSFVLKHAREQAEMGLKAKSDFLSTMSHEIRTPLNSVIGISHMLLSNQPREDQVKQLDVMLYSANHLLAIVNDILDYNKIEAGKISFEHIEMDVLDVASNVLSGLKGAAEKKNIAFSLHAEEALHRHVLGDPTRSFQVLSNLAQNAIKFTDQGSVSIHLSVSSETERYITIKFQVKDTGIGISEEKQQLIFDRFTQADSSTSRGFGGTGLGLAICKRILELQGAALQLQSREGQGSVFYFSQIFEKCTQATKPDKGAVIMPAQGEKPLQGLCILLVEDNPMNVLVARNFLQLWGATVDVAVNGAEALTMLDQTRHELILMDLHMPVMDGYEASSKLRERGVALPIIAITANLPGEIETELRKAGINDKVIKPFLPVELYSKILKYWPRYIRES